MVPHLEYRSQSRTALHLSFAPDLEFRIIVDEVGAIGWPSLPLNPELASFAILELLSNSVRAHREKGISEEVRLDLAIEGAVLTATVTDAGRGFDPSRLPYSLEARVETIDVMSEDFAAYRQLYEGKRFGMGLFVARKTFPRFRLDFVDGQGEACPWYSGKVKGTRIELGIPVIAADPDGLEAIAGTEVEDLEALDPALEGGEA